MIHRNIFTASLGLALTLLVASCGIWQSAQITPRPTEEIPAIFPPDPTQAQKFIPSPTPQITPKPTEEVPMVSPLTPTLTQETIPSPAPQITLKQTDEVLGGLVHNAYVRTGLDKVDQIINIVLASDTNEFQKRIQFTTSGCTHEMALGGPPKCREGEAEDTLVEVLPFLGPEGHFLRRDELSKWQGIDVAGLYSVYRVSEEAFSDKNYPAGEYGVVFRTKDPHEIVTLQVENGRILRVDYHFGTPPEVNFERVAQEIILPPPDIKTCQGAPPQRVKFCEKASVCTQSADLIVRKGPGLDSEQLTSIKPGTTFIIRDGPSCANNWSWWKVELDSGLEGWVAEGGDNIDPYFVCPVK